MEFIKNCFYGIMRKKIRSMLTIFGVAIGILSVVVISTAGEIGKAVIDQELNAMGASGITLSIDSGSGNGGFTENDLKLINEDAQVQCCMPVNLNYAQAETHQAESKCAVFGVTQEVRNIVNMKLLSGRLFTSEDIMQNRKVCLVDESFAKQSYHRTNITGKKISFLINEDWQEFTVIGVVASGGNILQGLLGNFIPSVAYTPIGCLSTGEGYSQMMIKLRDESQAEKTAAHLQKGLNAERGGQEIVKANNMSAEKQQVKNIINMISVLLTVIAGISLLVAGLSIMTVMLISVQERKHEIGIKKAIGAKKNRILFEFIIEAMVLCCIGGLIGVFTGLLSVYISCMLLHLPFIVNVKMILIYVSFSLMVGVTFGIYPANKAANLRPVEALYSAPR